MSADATWVQAVLAPSDRAVDVASARARLAGDRDRRSWRRSGTWRSTAPGARLGTRCARRVMAGVAVAGRGQRRAGGDRRSPGLPQSVPAFAIRPSPGDGCRRPFPRRACQLRHSDRWLVDRVSRPSRTPPQPALLPVLPPRWWRISPLGRRRRSTRWSRAGSSPSPSTPAWRGPRRPGPAGSCP